MNETTNKFVTVDVTKPFKSDAEQNIVDIRIAKNYWWLAVDGDPTKAVFFKHGYRKDLYPQCNSNKAIMDRLHDLERVSKELGQQVKVIQIPLAYYKYNL